MVVTYGRLGRIVFSSVIGGTCAGDMEKNGTVRRCPRGAQEVCCNSAALLPLPTRGANAPTPRLIKNISSPDDRCKLLSISDSARLSGEEKKKAPKKKAPKKSPKKKPQKKGHHNAHEPNGWRYARISPQAERSAAQRFTQSNSLTILRHYYDRLQRNSQ